jgi:hypothetical protein
MKWAGCHDLPREANAQQATSTPFVRSSNMAVIAKVEPALKYDILDITSHLNCLFGMKIVLFLAGKIPANSRSKENIFSEIAAIY